MDIFRKNQLYFPALTILAVVVLLLIWISISTYQNFNRDREQALEFVERQGTLLIHALESGVRAGLMLPQWTEASMTRLFEETGKNEDIAYIYLFDRTDNVLYHSLPSIHKTEPIWKPKLTVTAPIQYQLKSIPNGSKVYNLAKRFTPLNFSEQLTDSSELLNTYPGYAQYTHNEPVIVLGMNLTTFEAARLADFHHAMVMAGIVIALGLGALFFVYVIQNYYLVDRTLKETRDYTDQVVENMANGLFSINPAGKLVSYNQLALDLLGLDSGHIRETNLREILDFDAIGINQTLNRGYAILDRETVYRKKNGESISMSISSTPLRTSGGQISGAVVVLRDLREIKQLEEKVRQSEKLAAIGKLAAVVAHEIRNPLSSIRGFAKFLGHSLSERPHNPESLQNKEYADIMVKEVDRINGVVNDLLTLSRPTTPELTLTDINQMITHTIRLVEDDARSCNIRVSQNIASNMEKVYLDTNQVTQVLLNLILNAIQAIESDGDIIINAYQDEQLKKLYVSVEDDGPGVPPDLNDKIFDPFVTGRAEGNGLGLAIANAIMESHMGKIGFQSPPPGKTMGSRFTLEFSLEPTESNPHDK